MRILVTGFPPFPGRSENPSQRLIESVPSMIWNLPGIVLAAELLPVEYQRIEREFLRLLGEFRPDAVLAFGVRRGQTIPLRLESRGVNRDSSETPDNCGECRHETVIDPDGPLERTNPADLAALQLALQKGGLEVEIGRDAGTYICNHLVYFALQQASLQRPPFDFVFTHLAPTEVAPDPKKRLVALQIMIRWFHNQRHAPDDHFGSVANGLPTRIDGDA